MTSFFAELHEGNTDTDVAYEVQAPDLSTAMQFLSMFCLGARKFGGNIEIRGITSYRRKGTKYVRLG
jgi:hypothetical protein